MNEHLKEALAVLKQSEDEYQQILKHPGLYPHLDQLINAREQVYFAKALVFDWLKKEGSVEACVEIFGIK